MSCASVLCFFRPHPRYLFVKIQFCSSLLYVFTYTTAFLVPGQSYVILPLCSATSIISKTGLQTVLTCLGAWARQADGSPWRRGLRLSIVQDFEYGVWTNPWVPSLSIPTFSPLPSSPLPFSLLYWFPFHTLCMSSIKMRLADLNNCVVAKQHGWKRKPGTGSHHMDLGPRIYPRCMPHR